MMLASSAHLGLFPRQLPSTPASERHASTMHRESKVCGPFGPPHCRCKLDFNLSLAMFYPANGVTAFGCGRQQQSHALGSFPW
jgi:hypothetical protein